MGEDLQMRESQRHQVRCLVLKLLLKIKLMVSGAEVTVL